MFVKRPPPPETRLENIVHHIGVVGMVDIVIGQEIGVTLDQGRPHYDLTHGGAEGVVAIQIHRPAAVADQEGANGIEVEHGQGQIHGIDIRVIVDRGGEQDHELVQGRILEVHS